MWYLIAALPVLIWLYLLSLRGAFWLAPVRAARAADTRSSGNAAARAAADARASAVKVVAIIPARNEAALIGGTVRSLLQQRFPGSLQVLVVDDASSDATATAATAAAAALGAAARLTVIAGAPLPPGWTGKLWAMDQGVAAASRLAPDYVLFTDADVHHDADHLAALVREAEEGGRDLVSRMVALSMAGSAERWLMPAFVFYFFMLYPPAWVASAHFRTAAAAGGCMLVRPAALLRIGGLASIRANIIDDCALARAIKRSGGRISLALTQRAHSARRYPSWHEIGRMVSRTAFQQLRHSYALLALTLGGLALTYVLPPLLLLAPRPAAAALGAFAWALMSTAYLPLLRYYRRSALWSLSMPLISLFYAGATVHSAWQYRRGRGGAWKGRIQDVRAGGVG
jgi:hopene-associated glycosyltransferase HpnB